MAEVQIRQATMGDSWKIAAFLEHAELVHKHLDWKKVLDWIASPPFLLYFEDDRLTSLLSCAPDPEGVSWIHCFAAERSAIASNRFNALLKAVLPLLESMQCNLYTVSLQDWFTRIVQGSDFHLIQNIVTLEWQQNIPDTQPLNPALVMRSMEIRDLDEVLQMDNLAFDRLWQFSQPALLQAYSVAEHVNLIEFNKKVIAYELSTANHFSAHLARIAVHPNYTKTKIGFTLVREMLVYFYRKGIRQITVNTQDDNFASLSLYRKSNFLLSGEKFPVFKKSSESA